ncbi:hypothetical protein Kpol_1055p57 [Vanderwaltozyma polyspora DSM 70294]|uniref:GATA-type domain-containing protein n=1 Tax=Vanderwaltozyma polyspora (strain ATCC 22028 / DSM 70294 / BCRC 21397 / CBS 2163 / NBRC 10782 / NRRL Y-8283 / UCD 57-17) TaxID=436907 RepID=A7TGD0_VANPO|nr:uncharacterized protein Kpol_1055p57 [Vanderwaltozyma polyspora DSM 70294]EDO18700.1 hypothetical protein Kpol_1055p57 [Vanderwaltozyma polyspora DSM 70294]
MSTIVNQLHFGSGDTSLQPNGYPTRKHRLFAFDDLLNDKKLPDLNKHQNLPLNNEKRSNTAPASPYGNYYHASSYSINVNLVQPSKRVALPSLRHLQLLPDPRIQEYAYQYPDTSEVTASWKKNLIHWCKEKNYNDYIKIVNETSYDRFSSLQKIPSVLKPLDAFQNLSDSTNTLNPIPPPMTPPMTPEHNNANKTITSSTIEINNMFTPVISPKLVEMVKTKNNQSNNSNGHKKTNSFKAMQLKKMLDNRDILNYAPATITKTSVSSSPKRIVKTGAHRTQSNISNANSSSTSTFRARSRSTSPVSKSRVNNSPTRSHILKLTNLVDTETPAPRSISPVCSTPSTPQQNMKYHKFNIDSPPRTPATSLSSPTTKPTTYTRKSITPRRKSNGSNPQTLNIRKCVSCQSSDSPCWRPSWSGKKHEQLCNSCGLRYKKTRTRCLNDSCKKIPTKSELTIMKSNGMKTGTLPNSISIEGYTCLFCNSITETLSTQASPMKTSMSSPIRGSNSSNSTSNHNNNDIVSMTQEMISTNLQNTLAMTPTSASTMAPTASLVTPLVSSDSETTPVPSSPIQSHEL